MTLAVAFWVCMLIWLVWTGWQSWPNVAGNGLLFLLFVLLGWKVFGAPIHG